MNIQINKKRNSASALLLIIVGTIGVIVFGVLIYNLVKLAKRVDGAPYNGCKYTNDESIVIPGDKWDTNFVCWWQDVEIQWAIDDTAFAGYPPTTLLSQPSAPALTGPVVYVSLTTTGNVVLKIGWNKVQAPLANRTTFRDLGMPVDDYGLPTDFSWSTGTVPTEVGEAWTLQRSSNMIDWIAVATVTVRNAITNMHQDTQSIGQVYYRAVRP